MAVGWYTMLKMVPWADVISNAPQIADAAKKLWGNVARKAPPQPGEGEAARDAALPPRSPAERLAELESRLDLTEAALVELHKQMVESTQLIDTLASQNTLLVSRVEANRVLVRWLVAMVAVLGVAVIALWATRL
ncbi:hypothetical protein [Variovorax sp. OV329]|uniref:hypothetical protein n=1 Tax=Variovorax sp. OV329 TaxID=1882825 RepID=UPI0008F1A286|nr:hypothetical protein [Variovorax sp. OV329]SFM87403.1 hypothetical protein SAMN05444747_11085 [Variovorax sp. OV329]